MRLTLRTLLAYLDDTLPPDQAKAIGQKVAESETAQDLIDRIKKVTRRRGLSTPTADIGSAADPNTVADYLSDTLSSEQTALFEKSCLESDVTLAESAACHQILTLSARVNRFASRQPPASGCISSSKGRSPFRIGNRARRSR